MSLNQENNPLNAIWLDAHRAGKALIHARLCSDLNCAEQSCRYMKNVFEHISQCSEGDCPLANEASRLVGLHIFRCTSDNCEQLCVGLRPAVDRMIDELLDGAPIVQEINREGFVSVLGRYVNAGQDDAVVPEVSPSQSEDSD